MAAKFELPEQMVILAGDHLGPLTWQNLPEAEAMEMKMKGYTYAQETSRMVGMEAMQNGLTGGEGGSMGGLGGGLGGGGLRNDTGSSSMSGGMGGMGGNMRR